jgi:hypothetical protein
MGKLEDDLDELFRLPLAEFTATRNTLAARLKKGGRGDEAELVKALVKPSISAWTVNQLYWRHRQAFDRLIESGARFHKAQSSGSAGKLADMRTALETRREALTQLSDLATSLLREAGHNPTQDTIHRITTTLEAMSAYAARSDAPRPGRLTHDVDPPGFESLGSMIPDAGMKAFRNEATTNTRGKAEPAADVRQLKEARQARIAAAKASVQQARQLLSEARTRAQSLETAQKKAEAEAKEAEKQRREAEERFAKTRVASEAAARSARSVAAEVAEAAKAVQDAQRTVEKASKDLELLFSESG